MSSKELQDKKYLGDGVYYGHDGFQIWLWTSNGVHEENFIAIEPHLIEVLQKYVDRLRGGGDE